MRHYSCRDGCGEGFDAEGLREGLMPTNAFCVFCGAPAVAKERATWQLTDARQAAIERVVARSEAGRYSRHLRA